MKKNFSLILVIGFLILYSGRLVKADTAQFIDPTYQCYYSGTTAADIIKEGLEGDSSALPTLLQNIYQSHTELTQIYFDFTNNEIDDFNQFSNYFVKLTSFSMDVSNQNDQLEDLAFPTILSPTLQLVNITSYGNVLNSIRNADHYCGTVSQNTQVQIQTFMLDVDDKCSELTDYSSLMEELLACQQLTTLKFHIGCFTPSSYDFMSNINQNLNLNVIQYQDKINTFDCNFGAQNKNYIQVDGTTLTCQSCDYSCYRCTSNTPNSCKSGYCIDNRQYNTGYCDIMLPGISDNQLIISQQQQYLSAQSLNRLFDIYVSAFCTSSSTSCSNLNLLQLQLNQNKISSLEFLPKIQSYYPNIQQLEVDLASQSQQMTAAKQLMFDQLTQLQKLTIDFSNSQIQQFNLLDELFDESFPTQTIQSLTLNLRGNNIASIQNFRFDLLTSLQSLNLDLSQMQTTTDYTQLYLLSQSPSIQTITLSLDNTTSTKFTFVNSLNENSKIQTIQINDFTCQMDAGNFIKSDSSNNLICGTCYFPCKQCKDSTQNTCISCKSPFILQGNTCQFTFIEPDADHHVAIDASDMNMDQTYFDSDFVVTMGSFYASSLATITQFTINLGNNNLNSLSSLSNFIQSLTSLQFFQIQFDTSKIQDFSFLLALNQLQWLQSIEINNSINDVSHGYITVQTGSYSINQCQFQCQRCKGPNQNDCVTCLNSQHLMQPPTCDFNYPTDQESVTIDFSALNIQQSQINGIMETISKNYCLSTSAMKSLSLTLSDNLISNLTEVSYVLSNCQNLINLVLTINQNNYQYLAFFNNLTNIITIKVDDQPQCQLNDGQFIDIDSQSYQSYKCSSCSSFCNRCQSSLNCYSCKPRFVIQDLSCAFDFPAPDEHGAVTIEASNIGFKDKDLVQFSQQMQAAYYQTKDAILTAIINLEGNNQITDYNPLQIMKFLTSVQSIQLNLQRDSAEIIDLTFMTNYNDIQTLQNFQLDYTTCALVNKFIDVPSSFVYQWQCSACSQLCSRCRNKQDNNCTACFGSQTVLNQNYCVFNFIPISSGLIYNNFSNSNLNNDALAQLITNLTNFYQAPTQVATINLQLQSNQFTDLSSLSSLALFINTKIFILQLGLDKQPTLDLTPLSFINIQMINLASLQIDQLTECLMMGQFMDFTQNPPICSGCYYEQCNRCADGNPAGCVSCMDGTQKADGYCQFNIIHSDPSIINLQLPSMKINYRALQYIFENQLPTLFTFDDVTKLNMQLNKNELIISDLKTQVSKLTKLTSVSIDLGKQSPVISTSQELGIFDAIQNIQDFNLDLKDNGLTNLIDILKGIDQNEQQLTKLYVDVSGNELTSVYGIQNIFRITSLTQLSLNFGDNSNVLDISTTLSAISSLTNLQALTLNLNNAQILDYQFLDSINNLPNIQSVQINNQQACQMSGYFVGYQNTDFVCSTCSSLCQKCTSNSYCTLCFTNEKPDIILVDHGCQIDIQPSDGENFDFSSLGQKFGDNQLTQFVTDVQQQFTTYKKFEIDIRNTAVTSIDSLTTLFSTTGIQLANVNLQIDVNIIQKANDQTFTDLITNINKIATLRYVKINDWEDSDMLDKYIVINGNTISFALCSGQCQRCNGPDLNNCLGCISQGTKTTFNQGTSTCSINYPQAAATLNIDLSSIRMTNSQIAEFGQQIQNVYCPQQPQVQVTSMSIDISGNPYSDSSPLEFIQNCSNLQTFTAKIVPSQYQPDYTFLGLFNSAKNIKSLTIENTLCELDESNYIYGYLSQFSCNQCYGLCSRCYGAGTKQDQNCQICIDQTKLAYNTTSKSCEFNFVKQVDKDGYLIEDFSNIDLDNELFGDLIDQFVGLQLKDTNKVNINILNNKKITTYDSFSDLNELKSLQDLQLQFDTNKTSYNFLQTFNQRTDLSKIVVNSIQCQRSNHDYFYIGNEEWQCLSCDKTCSLCRGGAQEDCIFCASDYSFEGNLCVESKKVKKPGLEGWQIALIIVGSILAVAIAIAVVVIIKKKKEPQEGFQSYGQIQDSEQVDDKDQ